MKKMIILVICIILAVICGLYGMTVLATGSGTGFFLVWFGLAVVFLGIGIAGYFGVWGILPSVLKKIILLLVGIGVLSFVVIEGCVISKMNEQGTEQLDYIIVLGAQVRTSGPSKVLQYRLDRAAEYLEKNPNTVCIVSGGQGKNEPYPEAKGMADYLIQKGIPENRLLLEDKSKTTEQNISNSMKLMESEASVGIITNDFHVFRALQIAKGQGLDQACGIAAKSNNKYLPNNMLREYLAEIKYLVRKAAHIGN